jgi:hypothetical protein
VRIALILPILLSSIIFSEEEAQGDMQYELDVKFKYFKDLSDTYNRCASFYVGMYGYASNTPSKTLLDQEALFYMQQATSLTRLAISLNEEISYEGMPDIDKSMNYTRFIKRVVGGMVDGEKDAKLFIRSQLATCQNAIKAYPLSLDENK